MGTSHCDHLFLLTITGLNGYKLSKCLKEARKAQEEAEAAENVESTSSGSVEDAKLKYRQHEQPGELVTLPSDDNRISFNCLYFA